MKLPAKSAKHKVVDIKDYYAVRLNLIWKGVNQEGAAFWWLCIYLFFEYVRPQQLYKVIDVLPYAQIAIIAACITAFSDRSIRWVSNPGNVLFILFTIIVFLSSVFAFNPSRAFDKIDVPVSWLIIYFLIITIINTEKKFILFILLFFLLNFKMSQGGFITYAERGFGYARWGLKGSPGWFRNAGDFGIQMVIFASLSIAFILALKSYWGRYMRLLFYLLPITALVTIVGTASRGAQLGIVATGIWFLLKSRHGIRAMAVALIVGWGLYSILPEKMLEEYNTAGEDDTSEHRLVLWKFGLEVVEDHPVLGIGYENWRDYCHFVNPNGVEGKVSCLVPHNTYIQALSETGITGFVVFISILIFMFVLNARTRANAKQQDNQFIWYIAHGLDGGLVGCMVACMFFSILFYPMFWVQLALTVALHEVSKKQLKNSKRSLHKA